MFNTHLNNGFHVPKKDRCGLDEEIKVANSEN
jgi:hypothetical protein